MITVYNVNPTKLVTELSNAGFEIVSNSWDTLDEETQTVNEMNLYFADGIDMVAVQAVIDAHDTLMLPTPLSENELIMLAIADLDVQRETDKTETQLAIAELAETLLGGTV